jgi:hypothetical protein
MRVTELQFHTASLPSKKEDGNNLDLNRVLSKREMHRISRFPEYHAAVLSHEKKKKLAKAAAAVSVVADKSKDQVPWS